MIILSSGLRNKMLGSVGFDAAFVNGVIYLYDGPQPANADAAVRGTLLAKVTVDAGAFAFGAATNGLNFDSPVLNVISKAAAENWKAVAIAAGACGWGRVMGNAADALGVSTTLPRMDFSVGTSGSDLNLPTIDFVIGTPVTIDTFQLTLPDR